MVSDKNDNDQSVQDLEEKISNLLEEIESLSEVATPASVYTDKYVQDDSRSGFKEKKEKMEVLELQEKKDFLKMRSKMYKFLTRLLILQSFVILALIVLQGFGWWSFELDNFIFYILIGGSLGQAYFLVKVMCKYLFPGG